MAVIFLLINTSIFAIDGIIGLSNGMIHALQSAFPCASIWDQLSEITKKSSDLGLGGLLVTIAFLVLTVMLLVYYVGRLITLYIGAILSPLVLLLYLLPAFKDFAISALKTYLTTIFVLFVQVVIMQLASSIFSGMLQNDASGQPNMLMALILGLATVLALLKTQGVMKELSYAASTPRAAKEMAGSFMRGVGYLSHHSSHRRKRKRRQHGDGEDEDDKTQQQKKKKKRFNSQPEPSSYDYEQSANRQAIKNRPEPAELKTGETKPMKKQPVREAHVAVESPAPRPPAKPVPKRPKKEIET
jgi:hypothetical protein